MNKFQGSFFPHVLLAILGLFTAANTFAADAPKISDEVEQSLSDCKSAAKDYGIRSGCVVLGDESQLCKLKTSQLLFQTKDSRKTFSEFIPIFYCALRSKKRDIYFQRVKFPLPHISHEHEGDTQGVFTKKNLDEGYLWAVDGGTPPLAYAVGQKKAILSISSYSGMRRLWIFELINEKWTIVYLDASNF